MTPNPPQHSVAIVIGIASNSFPEAHVQAAMTALKQLFPGLRHSTPQKTAPLQHTGPAYLNAVATARTALPPQAVIRALKQLEQNQGRLPKSQTVSLDLDLLAYGNLVSTELRLPRKELYTRDFNRIPAQQLKCLPTISEQAFE